MTASRRTTPPHLTNAGIDLDPAATDTTPTHSDATTTGADSPGNDNQTDGAPAVVHDAHGGFEHDDIGHTPAHLADPYLDYYDFTRIEFLIFRNRLSAAALTLQVLRNPIREQYAKIDEHHGQSPTSAESELARQADLDVLHETEQLAAGAALFLALAAFESLLADLLPTSTDKRHARAGMLRKLEVVLKKVPPDHRRTIKDVVEGLAKIRNGFAHGLTGSYFSSDPRQQAQHWTYANVDRRLHTVGQAAILLAQAID